VLLLSIYNFRFCLRNNESDPSGSPSLDFVWALPLAGAPPVEGFLRGESAVTPLRANGDKGRGGDDDSTICAEFDHVISASFPEIGAGEYTVG
jgi:hypothetical protein